MGIVANGIVNRILFLIEKDKLTQREKLIYSDNINRIFFIFVSNKINERYSMGKKLGPSLFFLSSFLFLPFVTIAQNYWAKTYGGNSEDSPWKIVNIPNSGFAIEGRTRSFGSSSEDFLFFTADSNGTPLLQKVFKANNLDEPYAMTRTSDGGYLIGGNSNSFGEGSKDIVFLKLNSNGGIEWQKSIGGYYDEAVLSVIQTSDGDYIAAGWSFSVGAGGTDAWILKITPNGNLQWQKTYGSKGYDFAHSVVETTDGGIVFVGQSDIASGSDNDVWIVKLDNSGNIVWQKTYGGSKDESGRAVLQNPDGTLIVGAWSKSFGNSSSDFWLLKLNPDGSIIWQKAYLANGEDNFFAIERTKNDGYILVGGSNSIDNSDYDFLVLRVDGDGSIVWKKAYGGNETDQASSIAIPENGGFLVAGWSFSFSESISSDILVLKIDEDGNLPNGQVQVHNIDIDTLTTHVEPKDQIGVVSNTDKLFRNAQLEDSDILLTVKTLNTLGVEEETPQNFRHIQMLFNFSVSSVPPTLPVNLAYAGSVSIKIYDMLGREILNVFNGCLDAGHHIFEPNLSGYPIGLYFAVVTYKPF